MGCPIHADPLMGCPIFTSLNETGMVATPSWAVRLQACETLKTARTPSWAVRSATTTKYCTYLQTPHGLSDCKPSDVC